MASLESKGGIHLSAFCISMLSLFFIPNEESEVSSSSLRHEFSFSLF